MTTFTPAPWTARPVPEDSQDGKTSYWIDLPNGAPLADIRTRPDDEHEANARLIAAAPELLAALENVLAAWEEDRAHNRRKWNVRRDFSMMVVESCARNLIHTIKGE